MAVVEQISDAPKPRKAAPNKSLMYKGTVRVPWLSVGKMLLKKVPMTTIEPALNVVSCLKVSKPNLMA
jgi:hypothetical protein